MTRRRHTRGTGTDRGGVDGSRVRVRDSRRRRRKRRLVRGVGRLVFWALILAGVFVFGLGFGRTIGSVSSGPGAGEMVTITHDRGPVTATLPTRTVVQVKTVTKTVRRRARR